MQIYSFLFCLLLFSCGSGSAETESINSESDHDLSDSINDVNDSILIEQINEEQVFTIEEMPSMWIGLSDISGGEGEFAIQEPCYGGIPTLSFYQEIGVWWFTSFSGKEELTWEIASFEGRVTDNFGSELVKGSFVLENQSNQPFDSISFSWSKGQKMCQFGKLNMPTEYFVSKANKPYYTAVDAECDD